MKAREERTITITMTPVELRNLADEMERRWENLQVGQSTFVDFLHHSFELSICLHLDQEYFHKLNKGKRV